MVSGTEGVAKPDPRIYDLLARRAGLPPAALVFVDDRADNVAAAPEAGMDALLFTDAATLRVDLRARGLPRLNRPTGHLSAPLTCRPGSCGHSPGPTGQLLGSHAGRPISGLLWGVPTTARSASDGGAVAARPVGLAQLALEDLAGGVARQRLEDVDRPGALVVREVLAAVGDQLLLGRRRRRA